MYCAPESFQKTGIARALLIRQYAAVDSAWAVGREAGNDRAP
jgi:hypothetical protein